MIGVLLRAAAGDPVLLALFVLGAALSFVYVFQVYQYDFWRGERTGAPNAWPQQAVVLVLALVVLGLGVWPEPLLTLSDDAAQVLTEATP